MARHRCPHTTFARVELCIERETGFAMKPQHLLDVCMDARLRRSANPNGGVGKVWTAQSVGPGRIKDQMSGPQQARMPELK